MNNTHSNLARAMALILVVFSVASSAAAQAKVLSGSVQQSANLPDNQAVTSVVLDMYHQLSIMPGPTSAAQAAGQRFQADIATFNGYVGQASALAKEYVPCVQKYQQAYPHVMQQSQFYMQNNSKGYNAQAAIAKPLIQAGASCVNAIGGDQFSGSGSNPPPPTSGIPPSSWNLGVPGAGNPGAPQSPSIPPRYYQGRVSNDPCLPFGPGGYDYCANPTQPSGCNCHRRGKPPTQPVRNGPPLDPVGDTQQYLKGLAAGIGQCVQGWIDLLGAAAQMASGDFEGAARTLGLQPGQSVMLKTVYQELVQTKSVGGSPYELGLTAGRRVCAYGIPGPGDGEKPPAVSGTAPPKILDDIGILNTPVRKIPGKTIQTPWGPKRIGDYIGKGESGAVYKLPDEPGKVIKIGNTGVDSAPSFIRQLDGYNKIRETNAAPTPNNYNARTNVPQNKPSMIIADNIFEKWPGAQIVSDLGNLTGQQLQALKGLYDDLASKGFVWNDGHSSNAFFYQTPNGLKAGMVETDGLVQGSSLPEIQALNDASQVEKLTSIMQEMNYSGLYQAFNPQQVMNAMFQWRFGQP